MSDHSKIEWTDATWNPVTGCTKVSAGCKNCYAERVSHRFGKDFLKIELRPERLDQPLRWKNPRRIFVNSMSDLFHESVSDDFIDRVFAVMLNTAGYHTFQVLTKRPERMLSYVHGINLSRILNLIWEMDTQEEVEKPEPEYFFYGIWPHPYIWLGVSVEDQKTADARIPLLMQTPAAVRFVSYEPALGQMNFTQYLACVYCRGNGLMKCDGSDSCSGVRLNQVIAGGESGPGARPAHPDWFRSVRDQCQAAGVPFFFKQWGEWRPVCALYGDPERDQKENGCGELFSVAPTGEIVEDRQPPIGSWLMERIGKKAAGRLLDGREWNEFPINVEAA